MVEVKVRVSKLSGKQSENPNATKICHYCQKLGHIKSECRKKQADDKAKQGKGGSGKHRATTAAAPEGEPEPMSASPLVETNELVAAMSEILVDAGAGSNIFRAGFDPNAKDLADPGKTLVTVTGELITTGHAKWSIVAADGGMHSVEYHENPKVDFNVMSAGKAALKGTWTVIGPQVQCLVKDSNAKALRAALERTRHPAQQEAGCVLASSPGLQSLCGWPRENLCGWPCEELQ